MSQEHEPGTFGILGRELSLEEQQRFYEAAMRLEFPFTEQED